MSKVSPAQKYREFKMQTNSIVGNKRLNAKGRQHFTWAMLEHIGINNYDELEDAIELIQARKSSLSSNQRNAVKKAYLMCNLHLIENNKNDDLSSEPQHQI